MKLQSTYEGLVQTEHHATALHRPSRWIAGIAIGLTIGVVAGLLAVPRVVLFALEGLVIGAVVALETGVRGWRNRALIAVVTGSAMAAAGWLIYSLVA